MVGICKRSFKDFSTIVKYFNSISIRKLDQLAIDRYGIPGLLLMEHASLGLAKHVHAQLPDPERKILIFCGKGNNGGDGFAAARHLHNLGHHPEILLFGRREDIRPGTDAQINAEITHRMDIPIHEHGDVESVLAHLHDTRYHAYLDAVFGTGLSTPLRGIYPELFQAIDDLNLPITAVDVPSGLNSDTGMPMGAALHARQTVTFAFAKKGFKTGEGPAYCGEVYVVGIGLPRQVREDPERFLRSDA
jgi:NAD(P)H-hydrate epimerase